jgi:hypothetical protein
LTPKVDVAVIIPVEIGNGGGAGSDIARRGKAGIETEEERIVTCLFSRDESRLSLCQLAAGGSEALRRLA